MKSRSMPSQANSNYCDPDVDIARVATIGDIQDEVVDAGWQSCYVRHQFIR